MSPNRAPLASRRLVLGGLLASAALPLISCAASAQRGDLPDLLSPSLFGERRVLVVRSAQDLVKEVAAELTAYLADPLDDVHVVVAHAGGAKGKALLTALLAAKPRRVDAPKATKPAERRDFVRRELKADGRIVEEEAVAALLEAVGNDLRELASGLRPASLDAGLGSALRELAARSPIPVEVHGAPRRFPSELEAAAYFIACEGLTNAVKHAGAHQVVLGFSRSRGHLVMTVTDDGAGGADVRRGSGLLGLIDRARAHGGSLTVDSTPGSGTRVTARLPCA